MKILKNEPLKQHTSFRVGGPAKVYVVPEDIEELQKLIRFLHEEKLPYDIIDDYLVVTKHVVPLHPAVDLIEDEA